MTQFRIYEEALIGSLPFQVENPSNAKPLAFKELCDKKIIEIEFRRMAEIFNILPTTRDTHLFFRFRYFFRISFTSAISNFPMGYVDWISFQELLEGRHTPTCSYCW
jgi:hypothetical protein